MNTKDLLTEVAKRHQARMQRSSSNAVWAAVVACSAALVVVCTAVFVLVG
jgi:hypothetical protein